MPGPLTTIQRRDLGEVVSEYALEASRVNFAGLQLMPLFSTPLQQGNFPVIPVEQIIKPRDVTRGNRGAYNRGDWGFDQGNYATTEKGWEEVVDDALAANYRSFFDAESWAARIATDVLLRAQERRISVIIESQAANAVTNPWSSANNATPRQDVQNGIQKIIDETGLLPDTLEITYKKFQDLLKTDELQETVKYTSALTLTGFANQKLQIANYLGVNNIVVVNAIQNVNDEGLAFNPNQIWSNNKGFLAITSLAGLESGPQFGRSFLWEDDSPDNVNVETYREEQVRGIVVRTRHWTDEKVLNVRAGYLLTNL